MNYMVKQIFLGFVTISLVFLFNGIVVASNDSDDAPDAFETVYEENQAPEEIGVFEPEVEVNVTGIINRDYQLVAADGTVYEIEEGDLGDEMLKNIGRKVNVKGTVLQVENQKILFVVSYEVIE